MTDRELTLLDMCADINRAIGIGINYAGNKICILNVPVYEGKIDDCELVLCGIYIVANVLKGNR